MKNLQKKRILFVDDEESILQLALVLFGSEQYEVDTASDGKEALKALGDKKYDLVIADLNMGDIGGLDIYEHIKENLPELEKKVLFTTGCELNQKQVSFFRQIGANYIGKPFDPGIMKQVVCKLMEDRS